MWRSKKFIIIAVIAAVVLVGSIGGVVLAQGNGDENQPKAQYEALLDKVCAIYEENTGTAIDADELQNSFAQAQSEMQEEALQNQIQSLVDEGKLTQAQADKYLEWWALRPDVPVVPGLGGHSMHGGFGEPRCGFGGWFGPPPPPE